MERRQLLKMIMAASGVAMVGGNALAYEMGSPVALSATQFNQDDVMLFNDIAEVILPRTDTPGAKDANVGLMALILANDCYNTKEREQFVKGFQSLNKLTQNKYGKPFLLLSTEQKSKFVKGLDKEAKTYNKKQEIYYVPATSFDRYASEENPVVPHFFTMIKQLTIFTFFTSKEGATKVLRYEAIPGKYNGELDYKKGDRAWAT
ncbi:gluconate 2-dehydrogenase subunit 3 family protein [Paraglaciecola hydrolytica]|uniref:Twin-arginine translocation pathway signal n=1 Tax=Paraglaciecola hydrolytica TaxID=1799789 RepID=A0A136A376_9ALTE|nr:gluconate 2-dehydrogenase subunit 3 family protein [Paraglaciecola hydrolytica]KXI29682.1 Twin-arginine translocation pathway signal [Paraglaciecola hydrolytica]